MDEKDKSGSSQYTETRPDPATRARNKTVMLTPEITGQVRAQLSQGGTMVPRASDPRPDDVAATISPQQISGGQGFYSRVVQQAPVEDTTPRVAVVARPPAATSSQGTTAPAPFASSHEVAKVSPPRRESSAVGIQDMIAWSQIQPLVGFMVSFDHNQQGEVCTLRAGRITVTSVPQSSGSYLLIEDESVSENHAIMRISASGEIQVLDQLSENGTFIKRFGADGEIELSGDKSFLEHGDEIRFGSRRFHVSLLVRSDGE